MADFCQQCSLELFKEDLGDLAGLTEARSTELGTYASVRCEQCGQTFVDHLGRCVADCLEHHASKPVAPPLV